MRHLVVAALLLLSFAASAEHASGPPAPQASRAELDRRIDRIDRLLDGAQGRIGNKHALAQLGQARAELDELRRLLRVPTPPGPPPGFPTRPPRPIARPMPDAAFGSLLAAISREGRAEDQLRIVEQAAAGPASFFVVAQVSELLPRMRSDAHRLRAVAALRARILDPERSFELYRLFSSSADKATLGRILEAGDVSRLAPLSEGELRELVSALSSRWSPSERLRLLEQRAGSHWFLTAQVRVVLESFYSPVDRKQAVRILRPRILDPENPEPLMVAFLSPSDREDIRRLLR